MTDKWLDQFNEVNCYAEEGGDLGLNETQTDVLLLEALEDWLKDQLGDLFSRLQASSINFTPDGYGGILAQLDLEGQEFFPFLTIEICPLGMIRVTRVGQHMDNVINTMLSSREPNPSLQLLVEEFV